MSLGSREEKVGVNPPSVTGQHPALVWPPVSWMGECGGGANSILIVPSLSAASGCR